MGYVGYIGLECRMEQRFEGLLYQEMRPGVVPKFNHSVETDKLIAPCVASESRGANAGC